MQHIVPYSLFEDHYQMEIPFGKRTKSGVINDKPFHIQIIDAFHEFSKKVKTPRPWLSEGTWEDYIDDSLRKRATDEMFNEGHGDEADFYWTFFFRESDVDGYPEYYNKQWFEKHGITFTTKGLSEKWMDVYDGKDLDNVLTEEGTEAFNVFKYKHADAIFNDSDCLLALEGADSNGLKIYRAIRLEERKGNPVYDRIVKNYTGTGNYWSFDEEKADSYGGGTGNKYILYGTVRLQDIDWEATYMKTIWSLSEECEIEVKARTTTVIKLEKIFDTHSEKFLPLHEPIYVGP